MGKVVSITKVVKIAEAARKQKKSIVLAGGCFDILHVGHIKFLEKAKKEGDILAVLLESDNSVKQIKGEIRPINSQEDRAKVLSSLAVVDYIICLPENFADHDYDKLIIKIRPNILATTKGDHYRHHKERQARLVGARVLDVVDLLKDQSTTRLAALLKEEYGL